MSDVEFKVVKARSGNENQRKFGILATFGLEVYVDGTCIVALSDLKLSKSKAGALYVSSPYRDFKTKDGEDAKIQFIKLFPSERDSESVKAIIEQVKRECDAGGSVKNSSNTKPSNSNSTPAKNSSKTSSKSDW